MSGSTGVVGQGFKTKSTKYVAQMYCLILFKPVQFDDARSKNLGQYELFWSSNSLRRTGHENLFTVSK